MNRILVIDDDAELCELLIDYLQPEGFAVSAIHHAQQGLSSALSEEYDLVVLDVMLPGMSGFEVLRHIRAGSAVPVLMLTAPGEEIDRIIGREMGRTIICSSLRSPHRLFRLMLIAKESNGWPHKTVVAQTSSDSFALFFSIITGGEIIFSYQTAHDRLPES